VDAPEKPPILFANNVIRQTADHIADEKIMILPQDYTTLRVVFRKMGGSWEKIADGDIKHSRLLAKVVKHWSQLPGRKFDSEVF
jgi:hypothetical protein